MATTKNYSMPRGDSRSLPISIPTSTYSAGSKIFFTLKTAVDNDMTDNSAVLKKTLTDTDITSTADGYVNYLLKLTPADTNSITPATYKAEFEFVNAAAQADLTSVNAVVVTYPDPEKQVWEFKITGEYTRRTT